MEQFKSAPTQLSLIRDIRISAALQPRVARLIPVRDKGRAQEKSDQHIATLRLALEASERVQLEPVWLARIEGEPSTIEVGLNLIDGHHRLKAYKSANRREIPAKVLSIDGRTAIMLSKLVNCTGRSLEMHPEQCRDAAWQYIVGITQRGTNDLPKGESLRTIAATFGISKNTVSSMLTYIPDLVTDDFNSLALDPGTGIPRWRYVREAKHSWRTNLPTTPDEELDRLAERVARQIVKIIDTSSPTTRARALEMLANEEVLATDQLESVGFLSSFSPHPGEVLHDRSVPVGTQSVPSQLAHLDT